MPKNLLFLILFVAFFLRVLGIDRYPIGFTPDEASFGYDAYSLLKTGKDQWGEAFPLTFRSFGDFKLPLYTYLTIPSVAVYGLNEFSTRLPSALIGVLAILGVYLLSKELFSKKVAVVAATLLTISPWHLPLSRGAFEANLTVLFSSLGTWLFLKGLKEPRWLFFSALSFGVNLFTYHSARVFTPLLGLFLLFIFRQELKNVWIKSKRQFSTGVLVFSAFLTIAGITLVSGAGARGADIAIFNPTDKWSALSDERYNSVLYGLPDSVARIFSNKLIFTIREFTKNYVSYLSPQFLFTQGAGEWTYGMVPGHGVLYLFELIFIGLFLATLKKEKASKGTVLICLWIIASIIPAALTKGPGYAANRAATMMPAIQIASAVGAVYLLELLGKNTKVTRLILGGLASLFVLSFLQNYFFASQINMYNGMLEGRGALVEYANNVGARYEDIIISKRLSEPHIYVAFYEKWDPTDYQKESKDWLRYEKDGLKFVDQLGEYSLGKYSFRDINYEADKKLPSSLLIGRAEDFPVDIKPLIEKNNYRQQSRVMAVPSDDVQSK